MKKVIYLLVAIIFNSCTNSTDDIDVLKYSENDLIPLSDSMENLYYNDAAFIEFGEVIKDTTKRINQVILDEDAILSFYEDLLYIYNNSFRFSNSFFEYASSLHSHDAITLYQITVSVDTNKSWASNWKNGIKYTGLKEIDSLVDNYNLEIHLMLESDSIYLYEVKSRAPINYLSLMHKFQMTSEFIYVEPTVLVGGGSSISFKADNTDRYYRYNYGWGDCPSGCVNYHYWIVRLKDNEIVLAEEGGNTLNN